MQQRWWLFGVGAVGIVLAVLLFPRPDTGSDMPDPDPSNIDPMNFKEEKPLSGAVRPGFTPKPKTDPARMRTGTKPEMEEILEKRGQPAAIYSAKLQGPLGALKYALRKEGSDEARALSDELTPVITELRTNRRDPDQFPMEELLPKVAEAVDSVRNSAFGDNPDVTSAIEQYESVLVEYEEALASGGTAEDEEEG